MFTVRTPRLIVVLLFLIGFAPLAGYAQNTNPFFGEFGAMVRDDGTALFLFYTSDFAGFKIDSVPVAGDGSFDIQNFDGFGSTLSGTFSDTDVYVQLNLAGRFGTGVAAKAAIGALQDEGGFFTGDATGIFEIDQAPPIGPELEGTIEGPIHFLIGPDGDGMVWAETQLIVVVDEEVFMEPLQFGGLFDVDEFGVMAGNTLDGEFLTGASDFATNTAVGKISFDEIGILFDVDWAVSRTEQLPGGMANFAGTYYGSIALNADNDANADGSSDIYWRHMGNGRNFAWLMDEFVRIDFGELNQVGDLDWEIVGIGDFDLDGNDDILWRHATNGRNFIYLIDGKTIKSQQEIVMVSDTDWKVAGVGDLDMDGKADIVWRHALSGRNFVYLMNGFNVKQSMEIRKVSDLNWKIVGLDDFNGDGKDDILWRHSGNGRNYVYLMNGFTIVDEGEINTVTDQNWTVVATGDYDRDNNADIVWRNASNGRNFIYLMMGTSLKQSMEIVQVSGTSWKIVGSGNYDGDTMADLLWRQDGTGRNYIYLMDVFLVDSLMEIDKVADSNWEVVP